MTYLGNVMKYESFSSAKVVSPKESPKRLLNLGNLILIYIQRFSDYLIPEDSILYNLPGFVM